MNFSLATILPLQTPTQRQTYCASLLAIRHLNDNNNGVVPDLASLYPPSAGNKLTSLPFNSAYNKVDSVRSYRAALAQGAHGIIGAARSSSSIPVAMLAGMDAMPQVSSSSSSPSLSNKADYPFFARTYPSDTVVTATLPRVLSSFGWQTIGVLHVNDPYANDYVEGLRRNGPSNGLNVATSFAIQAGQPQTHAAAVASLKAESIRPGGAARGRRARGHARVHIRMQGTHPRDAPYAPACGRRSALCSMWLRGPCGRMDPAVAAPSGGHRSRSLRVCSLL